MSSVDRWVHRLVRVLLASSLLLAACSSATVDPADAVISGTVQWQDGLPASGSTVILTALPMDPPRDETVERNIGEQVVSSDGSFRFAVPTDPDLVQLAEENGNALNVRVSAIASLGGEVFSSQVATFIELEGDSFQPADPLELTYSADRPDAQ